MVRGRERRGLSKNCDSGSEYLYFVTSSAALRYTDVSNYISSHIVCYTVFITKTNEVAIFSIFNTHS